MYWQIRYALDLYPAVQTKSVMNSLCSASYWCAISSSSLVLEQNCAISTADTQLDPEVGFKLFLFTYSCWIDVAIKESGWCHLILRKSRWCPKWLLSRWSGQNTTIGGTQCVLYENFNWNCIFFLKHQRWWHTNMVKMIMKISRMLPRWLPNQIFN